jgi:hypothetical protein
VTKARRHDWWRATGEDHTWAIPDYPAIAVDYDAIHLTVGGYLSTAGRAIQAGGAHTVLAGWNPDETWWLTDSPRRHGEPVTWLDTRGNEPLRERRRLPESCLELRITPNSAPSSPRRQ